MVLLKKVYLIELFRFSHWKLYPLNTWYCLQTTSFIPIECRFKDLEKHNQNTKTTYFEIQTRSLTKTINRKTGNILCILVVTLTQV